MARTPQKGVALHLTEEQLMTDPANWTEPPATGGIVSQPQYIPFNANHHVRVKLTDYGRQVHREDDAEFWRNAGVPRPGKYRPPKEDADGWSRWQLTSLMERFGAYMDPGCENVFEMNIEIEVQDA